MMKNVQQRAPVGTNKGRMTETGLRQFRLNPQIVHGRRTVYGPQQFAQLIPTGKVAYQAGNFAGLVSGCR